MADSAEQAVLWATEDRGRLTARLDRDDAEKWAALGSDRGRRAVAVISAADLDALTARAEKAEADLRTIANRLYILAAPLMWAADGNNYLHHIEGYLRHLTTRAEIAESSMEEWKIAYRNRTDEFIAAAERAETAQAYREDAEQQIERVTTLADRLAAFDHTERPVPIGVHDGAAYAQGLHDAAVQIQAALADEEVADG